MCPVLLAVALAGCGGDDDGSGVDRDRTLSDLSEEEFNDLCLWSFDLFSYDDALRFSCYQVALIAAEGDQDQCQDIADECIEESEDDGEVGAPGEEVCALADGFPPCADEITVGQLEDCGEASADQAHDLAQEISCEGAVEDFTDIEPPEPCVVIEEVCPDMVEGDPEVTAIRLSRLAAARRLAGGL